MFRLLLVLCLIQAPLFAVTAGDKSPLELAELRVTIDLSSGGATVTCKATLKNPGDESHSALLSLPRDLVPEAQREGFTLKVAGIARESEVADALRWEVVFESAESVEVAWSFTLKPIDLPHTHPQGEREVRVPLGHMRGFAAVPETSTYSISSPGMPPELFGRSEGDAATLELPNSGRIDDYALRWQAVTWQDKHDALQKTLLEFSEPQRTHLNRSYTETLVHLADLYALRPMHTELANVCETLASLESRNGGAITHCGPWAEWRKYVPWQLLRMHALTQGGKDGKEAAASAKSRMAEVWAEYLSARDKAQPFEHFDRTRFGNYHDYDWDRTRDLYATALELLGESDAAKAVRDTE